jgi:hypothetical protein
MTSPCCAWVVVSQPVIAGNAITAAATGASILQPRILVFLSFIALVPPGTLDEIRLHAVPLYLAIVSDRGASRLLRIR